MVRVIVIIVVLLLLAGAVIGGLHFSGIDPWEKFNSLIGNAPPPQKTDQPAVSTAPPAFVDFGVLIVPVVKDHEVKKRAEMIVRLEVPSDKKDLIVQNLPRLQNAYLQDMLEFLSSTYREGTPLNADAIRRRLMAATEKTIGPGVVRNVVVEQALLKMPTP